MFCKNGRMDGEINRRVNASRRVVGCMLTLAKNEVVSKEAKMAVYKSVLTPAFSGCEVWVCQEEHKEQSECGWNEISKKDVQIVLTIRVQDLLSNINDSDLTSDKNDSDDLKDSESMEEKDSSDLNKDITTTNPSAISYTDNLRSKIYRRIHTIPIGIAAQQCEIGGDMQVGLCRLAKSC
uniref:Uncharacterized protein n=1 Tax=Timema monikensis TaxID=170555 RepID=A0A7R9EAR5_9NEOP|nr:unnamed protein product [Timema monikensis]